MRRQRIVHSYGREEISMNEDEVLAEVQKKLRKNNSIGNQTGGDVAARKGALVNSGNASGSHSKTCRCGSSGHQQTSHKDCPLRTKV